MAARLSLDGASETPSRTFKVASRNSGAVAGVHFAREHSASQLAARRYQLRWEDEQNSITVV